MKLKKRKGQSKYDTLFGLDMDRRTGSLSFDELLFYGWRGYCGPAFERAIAWSHSRWVGRFVGLCEVEVATFAPLFIIAVC
jgi:hypothetical protein